MSMARNSWSCCCFNAKSDSDDVNNQCIQNAEVGSSNPAEQEITSLSVASKQQNMQQAPQGNPRNKVALQPGHSLMDWIRLGNSGADLTSVGGKLQSVTLDELKEHHKEGNAWLVIRGKVYNVAQYLNFHPGGGEELMKGAGKDATKLFNEVHPWVNYESILQKCLVGRLVKSKSTQEDLTKFFFDTLAPPSAATEPSLGMSWHQTSATVTFRVKTDCPCPHVLVRIRLDNHVRILIKIRSKLTVFSFHPVDHLEWPCKLTHTDSGQLDVEFKKTVENLWKNFGTTDKDHGKEICDNSELDAYYPAEIVSINAITHNCSFLELKFKNSVALWIPIGHDIRIKGVVEGVEVARRYTPTIIPSAFNPQAPSNRVSLLIKRYPEGALTPSIFMKNVGDVLDVGGPGGTFNVLNLDNICTLYLIAAGTGITPMTRLIAWGLAKNSCLSEIKLLFWNRREEDIIWKKYLDELALSQSKFSVQYGLSEPSESWSGPKGRLNADHLTKFLSSPTQERGYVCVCGSSDFNSHVQRLVNGLGWNTETSFYFAG